MKKFRDQIDWDYDGFDWRSRATGTLDTFEDLFRTADGRWIVHRWIYRPGRPHYWFEITATEARSWLERVGYEEAVRKFFGKANS